MQKTFCFDEFTAFYFDDPIKDNDNNGLRLKYPLLNLNKNLQSRAIRINKLISNSILNVNLAELKLNDVNSIQK
jgi:hypothetical protein